MAKRAIGARLFQLSAPARASNLLGLATVRPCVSLSPLAAQQNLLRRYFSVTSRNRAQHAVSFTKTSDPELDAVLDRLYRLIVLPSYLQLDQRKKLYDPNHDMRADPITLEMDGEVIRFQHIDRFKDLPDTKQTLHRALMLMKTDGDWANLPPLLEGLRNARRKLRVQDLTYITAKAGYAGQLYQLLEAARTVQRTGFFLGAPEIITEFIYQLQLMAVGSGYSPEVTQRALKWADMALAFLEDDAHLQNKLRARSKEEGFVPIHREPHLLAARLHLAAAAAVAKADKKDVDGEVAKYAHIVTSLWPAGTKLQDLRPSSAYGVRNDSKRPIVSYNRRLAILAPIIKGLQLTVEVLVESEQQELADKVKAMLPTLEEEMEECRKAAVEGGAIAGPRVYQQVFGKTEDAAEATT